jgi:hypothetical protein
MPGTKYEYINSPRGSAVPMLRIRAGMSGIIHEVSFYEDYDVIRSADRDITLPVDPMRAFNLWNVPKSIIPRTLAECTLADLELLSSNFKYKSTAFPRAELAELRDLELSLMKTPVNYRKVRD